MSEYVNDHNYKNIANSDTTVIHMARYFLVYTVHKHKYFLFDSTTFDDVNIWLDKPTKR